MGETGRRELWWPTPDEVVDFYYAVMRDKYGQRLIRLEEWQRFGRLRRWRDIVLGWKPTELPRERELRLAREREARERER